jgi:hypothetical protein
MMVTGKIVTRKHLPRRTFLRGMGAALVLPMLDSMTPAFAGLAAKAPARLLFTYIPVGANMISWTPEGEGGGYKLSRILKPLEAFRGDLSVLSGLDVRRLLKQLTSKGDKALVCPAGAAEFNARPLRTPKTSPVFRRQTRRFRRRTSGSWMAPYSAPGSPRPTRTRTGLRHTFRCGC